MKKEFRKIKESFNYWFDKRMSKGSVNLIRVLILIITLVLLVLTFFSCIFHLTDYKPLQIFWDLLVSMLTISIPSLDSLNQLGYGIVVMISAIIGLVFTSVLIGIISSMIESRIIALRKGNSIVKERNHIVILG